MNKITGIIVGAVLVSIVGGVILKTLVFPSSEAPTRATTRTGFMDLIEVDIKIADILGSEPSGSGDAGGHYAKAVKLYLANKDAFFDATLAIGEGDAKDYPEVLKVFEGIRAHVSAGAKQADMTYMLKYDSGKLAVSKEQDVVFDLATTIQILDTLGDYYINNKRYKDADALFRDMLTAGWHMMKERAHLHMVMAGEIVQGVAMRGMIRSFDKDMERDAKLKLAEPLKDYNSALNDFSRRYIHKIKILSKARLDAGDVWNIAENDKDRAWRVQAILAMGMIKFTRPTGANAARNTALIEKFLTSEDPLEKAAAEAAKAYTEKEFNNAGRTW
jgi:hypothetical protein